MLTLTQSRGARANLVQDRGLIERQQATPTHQNPSIGDRGIDFVSDRVRNYEADPTLGLIADQVWLR